MPDAVDMVEFETATTTMVDRVAGGVVFAGLSIVAFANVGNVEEPHGRRDLLG